MSSSADMSGQRGGLGISGSVESVRDMVGRDKVGRDNIVNNYGATTDQLVAAMSREVARSAEAAGMQRGLIIMLAQRLKPEERLDFDLAVRELERAVEVALEVIATGESGSNDDAFVDRVLARVSERIRNNDLDGGVRSVDEALAELDDQHRRSKVRLLEEGVKLDILRRDAPSLARRIELVVAIEHASDRPAWQPAFRARYDEFRAEGETRGINFSLVVAIELARRLVATARDAGERGAAGNLLGTALSVLGERESGTARLEEAVAAYRAALGE